MEMKDTPAVPERSLHRCRLIPGDYLAYLQRVEREKPVIVSGANHRAHQLKDCPQCGPVAHVLSFNAEGHTQPGSPFMEILQLLDQRRRCLDKLTRLEKLFGIVKFT